MPDGSWRKRRRGAAPVLRRKAGDEVEETGGLTGASGTQGEGGKKLGRRITLVHLTEERKS